MIFTLEGFIAALCTDQITSDCTGVFIFVVNALHRYFVIEDIEQSFQTKIIHCLIQLALCLSFLNATFIKEQKWVGFQFLRFPSI